MKRKTLFNIHFYLSSFFTPFLLVIAFTGVMYLFGEKGSSESNLVREQVLLTDKSKKAQITNILKEVDSSYKFEYLKDRGESIQTRPTTRDYYNFKKNSDGSFSLYKETPNFLLRIIEVHKGHGPKLLKYLQKILGISLILIVFTGLWMSLQMKKRVKEFIVSSLIGLVILTVLFFL